MSLINFSYEGAEKQMLMALNQVQSVKQSTLSSKWESLLNNLGHTARKLGKLGESIFQFNRYRGAGMHENLVVIL